MLASRVHIGLLPRKAVGRDLVYADLEDENRLGWSRATSRNVALKAAATPSRGPHLLHACYRCGTMLERIPKLVRSSSDTPPSLGRGRVFLMIVAGLCVVLPSNARSEDRSGHVAGFRCAPARTRTEKYHSRANRTLVHQFAIDCIAPAPSLPAPGPSGISAGIEGPSTSKSGNCSQVWHHPFIDWHPRHRTT